MCESGRCVEREVCVDAAEDVGSGSCVERGGVNPMGGRCAEGVCVRDVRSVCEMCGRCVRKVWERCAEGVCE